MFFMCCKGSEDRKAHHRKSARTRSMSSTSSGKGLTDQNATSTHCPHYRNTKWFRVYAYADTMTLAAYHAICRAAVQFSTLHQNCSCTYRQLLVFSRFHEVSHLLTFLTEYARSRLCTHRSVSRERVVGTPGLDGPAGLFTPPIPGAGC